MADRYGAPAAPEPAPPVPVRAGRPGPAAGGDRAAPPPLPRRVPAPAPGRPIDPGERPGTDLLLRIRTALDHLP